MNIPRPPAHIEPYVTALGAEAAVQFFLHFGGAEFSIPRKPKPGSDLVEKLGIEAAWALCALADRTALQRRVPIPKPWLARYLKTVDGLSHAAIARRLHASDISVRRWVAGHDDRAFPNKDQLSLF